METTPQPGVTEAPDDITRVTNFLNREQPPEGAQAPAEPEVKPEPQSSQAESQELTPEDLPEETPEQTPPGVDDAFEIEIVHNGAQVKLNRVDTIKYAQQGLDATRKWEAAAEKDRFASQQLQMLQQVDQIRPHLQQQEGVVNALGAQLRQYEQVDWVKVATDDPMGYAPARAQYDKLVASYNQAVGLYQQGYQEVGSRLNAVKAQRVQQEVARLPEFVPEWKSPERRTADEAQIVKHYAASYGVDQQRLTNYFNGEALPLAIAYKAMKYDQLLKAKGEKVKQLRTAPPMPKPGASPIGANQDRVAQQRERLRKSGSDKDAAALVLNLLK